MTTPFKLYWFFGSLAFIGWCVAAYCLSQISPWALGAAAAAIVTKALMWLQDEAWADHMKWDALRSGFAKLAPEPTADQERQQS